MTRGGSKKSAPIAPEHGLAPGFWAALVLAPNSAPQRCYLGQVQSVDDRGVRMTLMDFVIGDAVGWDLFVAWPNLQIALIATPAHDVAAWLERAGRFQTEMNEKGASQ